LTNDFKNFLMHDFKKNYPDVTNMNFNIIALEVIVNYDTAIFG